MKSVFLILLSVILLLPGCKKKKITYYVFGIVTDKSSNSSLANISLNIQVKKSSNAYYTTLTTLTTDAKGKYTFSIENDLYEKIKITSAPTNYFEIERVIPYGELNQESNIYNLSTTAKSWARLIFNNLNPSPTDELLYIKQQGKVDCAECCPADEQRIYGAANDTIYCINNGNSDYSYSYSVIGTTNTGIKSVYTPSFDTSTIILNY